MAYSVDIFDIVTHDPTSCRACSSRSGLSRYFTSKYLERAVWSRVGVLTVVCAKFLVSSIVEMDCLRGGARFSRSTPLSLRARTKRKKRVAFFFPHRPEREGVGMGIVLARKREIELYKDKCNAFQY